MVKGADSNYKGEFFAVLLALYCTIPVAEIVSAVSGVLRTPVEPSTRLAAPETLTVITSTCRRIDIVQKEKRRCITDNVRLWGDFDFQRQYDFVTDEFDCCTPGGVSKTHRANFDLVVPLLLHSSHLYSPHVLQCLSGRVLTAPLSSPPHTHTHTHKL